MVGFTVSVLVLCNWKSKIFLFMTSCAAKQMYWYGNWWFQLVVELLWVLSYWDVYLWGIWKELVRNAVNFYLSFNDLQIHFLFKLRIRQNYFKCKLYQGFSAGRISLSSIWNITEVWCWSVQILYGANFQYVYYKGIGLNVLLQIIFFTIPIFPSSLQ